MAVTPHLWILQPDANTKKLLMIDIVLNNVAWPGPGTAVDYSIYNPFDDESWYHDYCLITNYGDQEDSSTVRDISPSVQVKLLLTKPSAGLVTTLLLSPI